MSLRNLRSAFPGVMRPADADRFSVPDYSRTTVAGDADGPRVIRTKARTRVLYVHATVVPPPIDQKTDRFYLLSEALEGDVLQPVWFQTAEEVEAVFGPGSYPVYSVGKFRYHWFLGSPVRGLRQKLATFRFYLGKGLELHRKQPFDCIVAYSHMTTGLLAGVLKVLTGAKLVIEVVTSPHLAYITERARPRIRDRVMKVYSDVCLHVSMLAADRAHFLYKEQTSHYKLPRNLKSSVFHDFVPVSIIKRDEEREEKERYVLLAGSPWYLKGADVLVKSFLMLAPEFPDVKLKMLGYYPDGAALAALTGGSPQIEILQARPHLEALKVIEGATVVVLPSRCEGLSRALIEGMAAGVPVLGSDIGGTPVLVRDGENGFLFAAGDTSELCRRMRQLLADSGLRRRMGDSGYARAHAQLDEKTYVREFARMIRAAVRERAPRQTEAMPLRVSPAKRLRRGENFMRAWH